MGTNHSKYMLSLNNQQSQTFVYVNLKNKTQVILLAKVGSLRKSRELQLRTCELHKITGKSNKVEGHCFMEKRKLEGVVLKKIHCRKVRVQSDIRFSLAELWQSVSYRRCNIHLSLQGPVIDESFLLRILLMGSVIDYSYR